MTVPTTIEHWHRIALNNLPDELRLVLAEDVVFESPVVHTPQVGRPIVEKYLRGALKVLNNKHFAYRNEWFGTNSAVLEFVSEIEGLKINGVDIIHWNEAGLITHFKVMVRPLKAINILHQKMGEYLSSHA